MTKNASQPSIWSCWADVMWSGWEKGSPSEILKIPIHGHRTSLKRKASRTCLVPFTICHKLQLGFNSVQNYGNIFISRRIWVIKRMKRGRERRNRAKRWLKLLCTHFLPSFLSATEQRGEFYTNQETRKAFFARLSSVSLDNLIAHSALWGFEQGKAIKRPAMWWRRWEDGNTG